MLEQTEVQRYLQRIGIRSLPDDPAVQLRTLHLAHLTHVPFENLDVVFGKPIHLDKTAILHKVIEARRGGFCYELNYGFYLLLQALGFEVQILAGQVWNDDGHYGPPYDHLFLQVALPQGPVIADISFGDAFCIPVPLSGEVSHEAFASYRVAPATDGEYLLLQRPAGASWQPMYRFTPQARQLDEFTAMAHYHQTSPDAPFTRKSLCTLATAQGRVTLSGNRLIMTQQGQKTEQYLTCHRDYLAGLYQHFGIVLGDEYDSRGWFSQFEVNEACGAIKP
ncbi:MULTISPECIES: arylamine N-acetyltransferase family protein [Dickeya]|uniref:Putative arylamine N-acetyltransferase, truncation n=1 Tax=Dickeya aquatica TaxID=1401087 RepID=A0A375AC37_9GAMM|nr:MULTISPECIES: arylamine N-acetyltransferase [Dickeya]SLM63668.1 putative arylamine N-acetyltransferase, truncation [Dickeya aquatica]